MAGLGSRFQKAQGKNPEYRKPKPLIDVHGSPMVTWATRSLPFFDFSEAADEKVRLSPGDVTFVVLVDHERDHGISKSLHEIYGEGVNVLVIPELTRGAAETVYLARKFIDPEGPLIISDSDHFFDGSVLEGLIVSSDSTVAGIIPVFRAPDDGVARWSYSAVDPDTAEVTQVGEKDADLMRKGAWANIGAYYFSKGRYFLDEVRSTIHGTELTDEPGKNEFYVAPIYQRLIENGHRVLAARTPRVWGLGTPSDLEFFLGNYKF